MPLLGIQSTGFKKPQPLFSSTLVRPLASSVSPAASSLRFSAVDQFTRSTHTRPIQFGKVASPQEVSNGNITNTLPSRLDFEDYVGLVTKNPHLAQTATQRVADMLAQWRADEVFTVNPHEPNKKLMLDTKITTTMHRRILEAAQGTSTAQRIILLDGPPGGAKSTVIHNLISHLELWSQIDRGASYTFEINLHENPKDPKSRVIVLKADDGHAVELPGTFKDPMNADPLRLLSEVPQKKLIQQIQKSEPTLPPIPIIGGVTPKSRWIIDKLIEHYTQLQRETIRNTEGGATWTEADIDELVGAPEEQQAIWNKVKQHITAVRFEISAKKPAGIGIYTAPSPESQDAGDLFGTINFADAKHFSSMNHPAAFEPNGVLGKGNRGLTVISEGLKLEEQFLQNLLDVVTDRRMQARAIPPTDLDTLILMTSNPHESTQVFSKPSLKMLANRILRIPFPYNMKIQAEIQMALANVSQAAKRMNIHCNPHAIELLAYWVLLTRTDENLPEITRGTILDRLRFLNGLPIATDVKTVLQGQFTNTELTPTNGLHGLSPRITQNISSGALSSAAVTENVIPSSPTCVDLPRIKAEIEAWITEQQLDGKTRKLYRDLLQLAEVAVQDSVREKLNKDPNSIILQKKKHLWQQYLEAIKVLFTKDAALQNLGRLDTEKQEAIRLIEKIRQTATSKTDQVQFRRNIYAQLQTYEGDVTRVQISDSSLEKGLIDHALDLLVKGLDTSKLDLTQDTGFCPHCVASTLDFLSKPQSAPK